MAYSSVRLTGWSPEQDETYQLTAYTQDANGLKKGTTVRIAGIKVGEIESIDLVNNKAKVTMSIYSKYKIPTDSAAVVKTLGILGDKFIEIQSQGVTTNRPFQDQDEIPIKSYGGNLDVLAEKASETFSDIQSITDKIDQEIAEILTNIKIISESLAFTSQTLENNIEQIVSDVAIFSNNLGEITENNKQDIRAAISNIKNFSNDISKIIKENKQDIRATVSNVKNFSNDISQITKENKAILNRILTNIDFIAANIKEHTPEITSQIQQASENLNISLERLDYGLSNIESISEKIDQGEGTIGKLVNEDDIANNLSEALESLNSFLSDTNKLKLDLSFESNFLARQGEFKSSVGVNIYPRRDHFYRLQLVSSPRGKTTEKTTTTNYNDGSADVKTERVKTDDFLLSLQVGQRFLDTQFRIGFIENTVGFGIDQFLGKRDQFLFTSEVWNLAREDEGPQVFLQGRWRFYNNLSFNFGVDDITNKNEEFRDYFIGLRLEINEDTLKTLVGASTISQFTN